MNISGVKISVLILLLLSGTAFAQYSPQPGAVPTLSPHDRAVQLRNQGDYRAAYAIFAQMAQRGDPDGVFHMGEMFELGHGVQPNPQEAFARYYWAAKRGHQGAAQAARNLQQYLSPQAAAAIRSRVDSQTGRPAPRPNPGGFARGGNQSGYSPSQPRVAQPHYSPRVGTPPIRPGQ